MSQAEHDELASAILVTDSREIADRTAGKTANKGLSRRSIIEASLRDFGAIVVCDTLIRPLI